jgi:hypothetical protein
MWMRVTPTSTPTSAPAERRARADERSTGRVDVGGNGDGRIRRGEARRVRGVDVGVWVGDEAAGRDDEKSTSASSSAASSSSSGVANGR